MDALLAPMEGTERRDIGGAQIDVGRVGAMRVRRAIYPVGFRWSVNIKPHVDTDLCEHGHVGFLAKGRIHVEFRDGCVKEFTAPQVVVIEPDHDAWVPGDEPAVLIEVDFERETLQELGLPVRHRHA
jgi:hypothetical protein